MADLAEHLARHRRLHGRYDRLLRGAGQGLDLTGRSAETGGLEPPAPAPLSLTPAADDDLEAVAALVNRAYRAGEGWTNEAAYLAGERTSAAALRADLAGSTDAVLLTLRDDDGGPLLGVVWLQRAGVETWYVGMLTVRPDLQDRKLGRRLLEDAEAFAIARGAGRIRMTVVAIRDTLVAWYERRGYRPTGEREPFPYADQRFGIPRRDDLDFVVLEKRVRP